MKIAIIESSSTLQKVWASCLSDTGFNFIFPEFDDNLINSLIAFKVNILVCPGVLYGQKMIDFIYRMKSYKELENIKIVLSTAGTEEDIRTMWDPDYFDAILPKPFTREQIINIILGFQIDFYQTDRDKPVAVIVDDSITVRSILKKEMNNLGFDVETAENGMEGIEKISDLLPDIALIDIEMPGLSGLEICEMLSSDPKTDKVPVIIISGTLDDSQIKHGFMSGAIDFLPKPVDSSQLERIVSQTVYKKASTRQGNALILEDSPVTASIITKNLKEIGITANICPSVAEFRIHLAISVPDLIFIDLTLQDGSGVDEISRVRAIQTLETVPIVVITGLSEKQILIDCLQVGANDYLVKPFVREEFTARINNLLKVKILLNELGQKTKVLENLAFNDGLTGLVNRRFIDENMPRMIRQATEQDQSLSFVMIDLDFFKKVNDTYGHEIGDVILQEVAQVIKQTVRGEDVPCRYGGEEMCVFLPNCSLMKAKEVAERIRAGCNSNKFSEHNIEQTVSIGVSSFPDPSDENTLVADADSALYKAKDTGRNKVLVFKG